MSLIEYARDEGLLKKTNVVPNIQLCHMFLDHPSFHKLSRICNTHPNSIRQRLLKSARNIHWHKMGVEENLFKLPTRICMTLFRNEITTTAQLQEVHNKKNHLGEHIGYENVKGLGDLAIDKIEEYLEFDV